jgi:hypothetical protein
MTAWCAPSGVVSVVVALDYARQHLSDAVKVQEVLDAARYPQIVEEPASAAQEPLPDGAQPEQRGA